MSHLMLFSERPPIYASSFMTISGERTEQHVVIGFGELAAVNYNTDTGLLVCSQKAKIQNKHKTQVKYSAK